MHTNVQQLNTNANKYVPPRQHTNISTNANKFRVPAPTEKIALKKEFQLKDHLNAFPLLCETIPVNKSAALSFAQAMKTEQQLAKNMEHISEVPPGWVNIRYKNKEIQYKYGEPFSRRYPSGDANIDQDARISTLLLKYRLAKEQYEHDNDVLRLGDYSAYYNSPTLLEQFAEEELRVNEEYLSDVSSDNEY
jgi:hypothetical protein